MTIAPLATTPAPATPPGSEDAAAAPGDFLAILLSALGATPSATPPDLEHVETPATPAQTLAVEPVIAQEVEPVETPATDAPATPIALDPALIALVVPQTPVVVPRLDKLDVRVSESAGTSTRLDKLDVRGTLDVRAPHVVPAPLEPAVAGTTPQTSVPAEALQPVVPAAASASTTSAPAVAAAPSIAASAAQAATATPPTTTPSHQLDRVSAQVFPEVTSLVSRGNGTHRITLTLNPEHLGEVRVVMTMRAGEVHVRLAAGQEAQGSLLEGSPELSRLLERAGATEARVVVRDLPGVPPTPTSGSANASFGAGSDRPTDQHAGTRAEHQARDGDTTPSQHRSPVLAEVRPIQPVTDSRLAGVDLTM